jgi:hypothetical protein
MYLHPKFIIENDNLILMKVSYHIDIVTNERLVRGGGWYKYKPDSNTYIFHDKSTAFGAAKFEDIKRCVENGRVYTDKNLTECVAGLHNFSYDNGTEIVPIYKIKNGMVY